MKPIGLTMKRGRNKYQRVACGELMLIHECLGCRSLSINRIAADDDSETVAAVFQQSVRSGTQMHAFCREHGISELTAEDVTHVYTQLYGSRSGIPMPNWT
jgi:hypothetical protein